MANPKKEIRWNKKTYSKEHYNASLVDLQQHETIPMITTTIQIKATDFPSSAIDQIMAICEYHNSAYSILLSGVWEKDDQVKDLRLNSAQAPMVFDVALTEATSKN